MLEYILLGFLAERDLTGYEIKQAMEESASNFVDASFGSIYPALKRMQAKGFIQFTEAFDGGKYKKRYSLLEEGRRELLTWLREPVRFSPLRYEYLAKLFFYRYLEKEEILPLLDTFLESVEQEQAKLDKLEDDYGEVMEFHVRATLRFGRELYSFIIDWHQRLKAEIAERK